MSTDLNSEDEQSGAEPSIENVEFKSERTPNPRTEAEDQNPPSSKESSQKRETSFSVQVLEYYRNSGAKGARSIGEHYVQQSQILEAGKETSDRPNPVLPYVGLSSGLDQRTKIPTSHDKGKSIVSDVNPSIVLSQSESEPRPRNRSRPTTIGTAEAGSVSRPVDLTQERHRTRFMNVSETDTPDSEVKTSDKVGLPRERKKWVKPPLFGHSSGSDDVYGGDLFGDKDFMDRQQNLTSMPVGQQKTETFNSQTLLDLPHQSQDFFIVPICLESVENETQPKSNQLNLKKLTEENTEMVPDIHETRTKSNSPLAIDVSLETSGLRISSPSSSIASNKRTLEWDSGADVGYQYETARQLPTIGNFESMALAGVCGLYSNTNLQNNTSSNLVQQPAVQSIESKSSQDEDVEVIVKLRLSSSDVKNASIRDNFSDKQATSAGVVHMCTPVGGLNKLAEREATSIGQHNFLPDSQKLSQRDLGPRTGSIRSITLSPVEQKVCKEADTVKPHKVSPRQHSNQAKYEPLAHSTPIDSQEIKTKAHVSIQHRLVERGNAKGNVASSYFPSSDKKTEFENAGLTLSNIISPNNEVSKHEKNDNNNRHNVPSTEFITDKNQLSNNAQDPKEKFVHKLVQTSHFDTVQCDDKNVSMSSDDKMQCNTVNSKQFESSEKSRHVFCVEEIKDFILKIQRKANEHQAHIDKYIKQTNTKQVMPHTLPRTYRDVNCCRGSICHKLVHSSDKINAGHFVDNMSKFRLHADTARDVATSVGSQKRSESLNSLSPSVSPQLHEEESCSSKSSCYGSDNQSGNIANEHEIIGSSGSFEYLPGHVYEKTNRNKLGTVVRVPTQRTNDISASGLRVKSRSLEEDLKVWGELYQNNIVKVNEVVEQLVTTTYDGTEEDEEQHRPVIHNKDHDPSDIQATEHLNREGSLPLYIDKGTQIEENFGISSTDVESNTSSRRPSVDKINEESSDKTLESSRPSSCNAGIEISKNTTVSSGGYNSSSNSCSNGDNVDWRKPATQSEQEFEKRRANSKKHHSHHVESKSEKLAIINEKINHLTNLKMILESREKCNNKLKESRSHDSILKPKQRISTMLTARNTADQNEIVKEEFEHASHQNLSEDYKSSSDTRKNLALDWSSHCHLISRKSCFNAAQIPITAVFDDQEISSPGGSITPKEYLKAHPVVEVCTQTSFANETSQSDAEHHSTNQGKINTYTQTSIDNAKRKRENTRSLNKNVGSLCCCECEASLSMIKDKVGLGVSDQYSKKFFSTKICHASCSCNCHQEVDQMSSTAHYYESKTPVFYNKSNKHRKNEPMKTCKCTKLCTSSPIVASSSTTHNGDSSSTPNQYTIPKDKILKATQNSCKHHTGTDTSEFHSKSQSETEKPRKATRDVSVLTIDNKGVQTSDSVAHLPVIRPLWFSTSNSHVRVRGKKCVCCSRQSVKSVPLTNDSDIGARTNGLHVSSLLKNDDHLEKTLQHTSSLSNYESSTYENITLRCQKCCKDIKICKCRFVKKSSTSGPSEDSWDVSSLSNPTDMKPKLQKSTKSSHSVGYLLTFETASESPSSSTETVRKRSLQEIKIKLPSTKSSGMSKGYVRKKDKTKSTQTIQEPLQDVHIETPARKPHAQHKKKTDDDETLNRIQETEKVEKNNDSIERTKKSSSHKKVHEQENSHRLKPTLQDYLRAARPDYIQVAEARRKCLAELADLRLLRHEHRQRLLALASQPGNTVDAEALNTANSLLPPPPMAVKRVFTQKTIRKQTEKGYKKCPEVISKKTEKKRKEDYRTNRLMAEIFTKKLQKKVLQGTVNLSNSVSIITTS